MGPSFGPRPCAELKNSRRALPVFTSLAVWVMAFGALTEKRKLSGVVAAQRSQVARRCGRWKLELISTQ